LAPIAYCLSPFFYHFSFCPICPAPDASRLATYAIKLPPHYFRFIGSTFSVLTAAPQHYSCFDGSTLLVVTAALLLIFITLHFAFSTFHL